MQPSSLFTWMSSSSQVETLDPLNNSSSLSPPPRQPSFYFVSVSLTALGTLYQWNHIVFCPFVTGLFHLVYCFLSIHPLMVTKIASIFKLLWIMLLWTWMQIYLPYPAFNTYGYLPRCGNIGLYCYSTCFFLKELTYILFSIATALFYIPTNYVQGFQFLHIHTNICHFLFFSNCYLLLLFYSSRPNGHISLWFWSAFA